MAQLTRKEREQIRKREEILSASLTVFAQKGYHGATMSEISKISEYPLGTIYKFFQGKEYIYHEMVLKTCIALGDILLDIISKSDWSPTKKINEYLKQYVNFGLQNKDYFLVYNSQRNMVDEVLVPNTNQKITKLHNKMLELLGDIFREGIEKKEFRDFPEDEMASIFSSITFSTIWSCAADENISKEKLDKKLETIFNIYSMGVCTGKEKKI